MKRNVFTAGILALLLVFGLVIMSCGDGAGGERSAEELLPSVSEMATMNKAKWDAWLVSVGTLTDKEKEAIWVYLDFDEDGVELTKEGENFWFALYLAGWFPGHSILDEFGGDEE
jgi:hypothetical protein